MIVEASLAKSYRWNADDDKNHRFIEADDDDHTNDDHEDDDYTNDDDDDDNDQDDNHLLVEIDGAKTAHCGNDTEQVENPVQLHFGIPIRALWRKQQHYNDGLPWWWY